MQQYAAAFPAETSSEEIRCIGRGMDVSNTAERDDSIRGSNGVTGLRVRRTARPQESRRRHLGTGVVSTENLCQVECMPSDANSEVSS